MRISACVQGHQHFQIAKICAPSIYSSLFITEETKYSTTVRRAVLPSFICLSVCTLRLSFTYGANHNIDQRYGLLDHLYSGEANPKQTFQLTPETWICYVNCYLIEIFRSISHLTKNLKIFSVGLLVDQMRQICSKSKFYQSGIKIFLAKNVTRSALHLLWICLARVKMVLLYSTNHKPVWLQGVRIEPLDYTPPPQCKLCAQFLHFGGSAESLHCGGGAK